MPHIVFLSYNNHFFLGRGLCLLQTDAVFRFFYFDDTFKHLKYSFLHNNLPRLVALL